MQMPPEQLPVLHWNDEVQGEPGVRVVQTPLDPLKKQSRAPQLLKHEPQVAELRMSASQPFAGLPSQSRKLAFRHVHDPPAQAWFVEHEFPHAPQLVELLDRFTQVPLQFVVPVGQLRTHWPPVQTWPDGQTVPHAPQLEESLVTSTMERLPKAVVASVFTATPGNERLAPVTASMVRV